MKCRHCGCEIPEDMLVCEQCGREVRIVPDYNPLDEVLAAQIKGSIDGTATPLDNYEFNHGNSGRQYTDPRRRNTNAGRRPAQGNGTGRMTGRITGNLPTDREQRRKQAEKRRELKRKKRTRLLIIMGIVGVLILTLGIVLYQNSYTGQVRKGIKAASEQEYDKAIGYFEKSIGKKPKKVEAYTELSKVYIKQDRLDEADGLFIDAIEKYPVAELYEGCISFYMGTDQEFSVSPLLEDAPDIVRQTLSDYVSLPPEFSLDDSAEYDDVQQLTLTTEEEEIYYTTDGTEPTTDSTLYTEPLLIKEGETTVTAISFNKKGVPSLSEAKIYKVVFPVVDAPAVTPSTGQYEEATQITINIPEGYQAYYTTDKSEPTAQSTLYEGPVDMPEGSTIFKAVLINAAGRSSGITTRNYELTYQ